MRAARERPDEHAGAERSEQHTDPAWSHSIAASDDDEHEEQRGDGEVPDAVEERGRPEEGLPPEEGKALGELPADADRRREALLLEGRPHREQREEGERVRDRVGGERDRPSDAVEDTAEWRPCDADARRARLLHPDRSR